MQAADHVIGRDRRQRADLAPRSACARRARGILSHPVEHRELVVVRGRRSACRPLSMKIPARRAELEPALTGAQRALAAARRRPTLVKNRCPKLRTLAPTACSSRSSTTTLSPRRRASCACARPTMPAPTTHTSASIRLRRVGHVVMPSSTYKSSLPACRLFSRGSRLRDTGLKRAATHLYSHVPMSIDFAANDRTYAPPSSPVLAICADGWDPEYVDDALERALMPRLAEALDGGGTYALGRAQVPTFTNPNNVTIVTGVSAAHQRDRGEPLPHRRRRARSRSPTRASCVRPRSTPPRLRPGSAFSA